MKNFSVSLLAALFFFAGITMTAQAQNNDSKVDVHLSLKARNYGDKVVLRWGFSEPNAWRYLNGQGFQVERIELDNQTNKIVGNGQFTVLSPAPVKPWTREQWAAGITARDTFAVVAAQCLLGESSVLPDAEGNMMRTLQLQQAEEANRFTFALMAADLSSLAADGLGLRFEDKNIQKGKKYVYRLHVNDVPGDRFRTDTALYVVATNDIFEPIAPEAPEATEGDTLITLKWRRTSGFTAYHVERSADAGKTWIRLTQHPFFNMQATDINDPNAIYFSDRLKENYQPFQYRLLAITPFGELTPPSEIVEAQGIDLTPTLAPVMTFAENTKGNRVELRWEMAPVTDLKGFMVSKSTSIEGPWEPMSDDVLPANTRSFTDDKADEFSRNFYRVYSVDDHGNFGGASPVYIQMKNSAPPATPEWVGGTIDTSGMVTLRWKLNKDKDLWGYQLYYSNQTDHIMTPLTNNVLQDTMYQYQIPLDNLTENIFFTVKAVDMNYLVSEPSKQLKLAKPDKIAPVSPLFSDYMVRDTGVMMTWINSSSKDVVSHKLQRREPGGNWETISTFTNKTSTYFDKNIVPGKYYEYAIYAHDDAGLISAPSKPLSVKTLSVRREADVENLKATVAAGKPVKISWTYNKRDRVEFSVYREKSDGSLQLLGKTKDAQWQFEDNNPASSPQKGVRYAVRASVAGGGVSPLAKTDYIRI